MTPHTTSSLRVWDQCKRLYLYEYVQLVRPARSGKALGVGTATHGGLECFMKGGTLGAVLEAAKLETPDRAAEIEQARVRAMLAAYFSTWSSARANWEVVEVEGAFEVTAGGVLLAGKRDALLRHKPTGKLYLVEHKTTSDEIDNVGTDYWQRLLLDRQLAIYQHDVEQRYGETPEILYDVIRKPAGEPKLKKSITRRKDETDEQLAARKEEVRETIAEFGERMTRDMLAEPGKYLVRREVHQTREQVDRVLAEVREVAGEIDGYRGTHPRNDSACKTRFGVCPFLSVCAGLESLDSEKFVTLDVTHPELGQTQTSEDADGSSSEYSADQLPF